MHFEPDALYHVYNRSNETVFATRENYLFFLRNIKRLISPLCNLLAYVLMPNHFHFLIETTNHSCEIVKEKHRPELQQLAKNFGTLLGSYSQALNKQENRKGSLFAHGTAAKMLNEAYRISNLKRLRSGNEDYATTCFLYIHQNPVLAGLTARLEDWEFSSFRDYAGFRDGTLVKKELAFEYISLDKDDFYQQSAMVLNESILKRLY